MPKFNFTPVVNSPQPEGTSACLGDGSKLFSSDTDLNKLAKLGDGPSNYVLTDDGDEIEGFIYSVEPQTYNDGYSFGRVQFNKRLTAEVGAFHDGSTNPALGVGDFVVANDQADVAQAGGPRVKKGDPGTFKWRVIRIISGTGVTGDSVLIERV